MQDGAMTDQPNRNPIIDAVVTLVVGAMSSFWLDGALAVSDSSTA